MGEAAIGRRVERHPTGQIVIDDGEGGIAAAAFTQRISAADVLDGARFDDAGNAASPPRRKRLPAHRTHDASYAAGAREVVAGGTSQAQGVRRKMGYVASAGGTLSLPQAKFAFLNSQSLDQLSAGASSNDADMTTLEWDKFRECVARCGVDKYADGKGSYAGAWSEERGGPGGGTKPVSEPQMIAGFIQTPAGDATDEQVLVQQTLVKAQRFDLKRKSKPIASDKGPQPMAAHRKWLACWERVEIMDLHHFPLALWEHDLLQAHFAELSSCFLGYTRSISETSAEDALKISMFVTDCRKNAAGKTEAQKALGGAKKVSGANAGGEAKKDQELVLYEVLAMLVRISFWRDNPNWGDFGNKRQLVPLPGCLEKMLVDEVVP
jgi:hypothetical protein